MLCKIPKKCTSHIVVEARNLVTFLLTLPIFFIEKFTILMCVFPNVSV